MLHSIFPCSILKALSDMLTLWNEYSVHFEFASSEKSNFIEEFEANGLNEYFFEDG